MGKTKKTQQDLEQTTKDYEANFKKLCATVGTEEHSIYSKEEKRLNALDTIIRKDLGIFIHDPCPLTSLSQDCPGCSGWYKQIEGKTITKFYKTSLKEYIEAKKGEGEPCQIKEMMKCEI